MPEAGLSFGTTLGYVTHVEFTCTHRMIRNAAGAGGYYPNREVKSLDLGIT